MAEVVECRRCGLLNSSDARKCDCGYVFATRRTEVGRMAPAELSSVLESVGLSRLSPSELVRRIVDGGRIVRFEYCVSAFYVTHKRTVVKYIPPGGWVWPWALKYAFLSALLGWWAIPLGPIWTILAIVSNVEGGTDLSAVIVATLLENEL